MKLFGYYRSSASYRIRILLNLKEIDYEYVAVLLNKGEQKHADFLARNPSGLVPVLDTGEQSLGQSLAIAEYLEERFPEPALLPADPAGRARVREMLATVACDIHPLQNLRVLNYLRQEFSADDEAVSHWIERWISNGFTALEQRWSPLPWRHAQFCRCLARTADVQRAALRRRCQRLLKPGEYRCPLPQVAGVRCSRA